MNLSPASFRVAVIGGGPAGLMAAEQLASQGTVVTIYDQMPSVGRKFMLAGRGGLNLTHSEPVEQLIARYGAAAERLGSVIKNFPPSALREWCQGLGQETFVGSSGRVFPQSLKASPLLRAWLRRLNKLGVLFALRHRWLGWDEQGNLSFTDAEGKIIAVQADAVILALGGASWPRLGSNGDWVDILRQQGIAVSPLRPANCGFVTPWSSVFSERFAGQPLKPMTVSFNGQTLQGEAMIIRQGMEGGVIYALSAPLRDVIEASGAAILSIDLRPGVSLEKVIDRLQTPRGSQSSSTYLRKAVGLSPLAIGLLRESMKNAALPTQAETLARLIKAVPITFTATAAIDRAISSAGGVALAELDSGFMLTKRPGTFAIGEMLDWEAPTGGYLLQASFSMAVAAAKEATDYLMRYSQFA